MESKKNFIQELNKTISQEKSLLNQLEKNPKNFDLLFKKLKQINNSIPEILEKINISKKLPSSITTISSEPKNFISTNNIQVSDSFQNKQSFHHKKIESKKQEQFSDFDSEKHLEVLKRIKYREKEISEKKLKKPSKYVKLANRFFSKSSIKFINQGSFRNLKRDLAKANLSFLPASYVSVIFFTTFVSIFVGIFLFLFFLFFNLSAEIPFITSITENFSQRFLKTFWILFAVPIATFLMMYVYPSLERKSTESKIDQELPFVAIHMSAISGSMVEPSRMFSIIIATKEYPFIQKEFTKLINKINVYGYNLVNALRDCSANSASKKLAELFNGMATTITSGGDLREFFEKRAQTLLFEYRLAREKYTRSAETFMDIYISVVIAAPMIFMLLLIIIKVSNLGISLSTNALTFIIVAGVALINIVFLVFLNLKQPTD